jgi:hypothetical protein
LPFGLGPPVGGNYPDEAMASPYLGDGQEIFRPDAYSQTPPFDFQQPPPEPIIEYIPAEAPEPSKEFQKTAFNYITEFCRASSEFMKPHISRAERNWKWYRGLLSIQDLEEDRAKADQNVAQTYARKDPDLEQDDRRQSDFLFPINQLVNSMVAFMNLSIFSGPDYLTLTNEDDEGVHSAEDLQRQNDVIKRLLLKRLRHGRFKSNQRPLLTDCAVTGNAISATFYYKHEIMKWREMTIDGQPTGQIEEYPETVYECPITQGIKMTRFLPDHRATTTDVNRWRGVGHIIKKTYDEVLQDFNTGYYHLNQSEFEKRFKNVGPDKETHESVLNQDPETNVTRKEDSVSELTLVEWQGKVPDDKRGMVEVVGVIVYDKTDPTDDTSFKSGLLIRLSQETISESGIRTINVCHWTPGVGPIGMGIPDADIDFFYQASQFLGQIHDAAKKTCTGAWIRDASDNVLEADLADDSEIYAGRIVKASDKASLAPLPHADTFNFGEINNLAQQFIGLIERSVGAQEPSQNNATDMKATVYTGLQQRSQAPGTVLTQAYAEEIITPAANLSLSFLVANTFENQTVLAPDADTGQDIPMQVTPDDLRRGKWVVEAALTSMDNSQMAAAQIIKDLILQAAPINQEMAQEGKVFSVAEALNIILTQTKAPNTNRLVRTFSTREQVLMDQNQQMQQQIMEMDKALQSMPPPGAGGGQGKEQKEEGPSPGANGGSLPEGFGMGGGPLGPEPTDENMEMLMMQLDAANRQGVPM